MLLDGAPVLARCDVDLVLQWWGDAKRSTAMDWHDAICCSQCSVLAMARWRGLGKKKGRGTMLWSLEKEKK